jgi:hypothetical protein
LPVFIIFIYFAFYFAPPVLASVKSIRNIQKSHARFQFGIPELLLMPLLLAPTTMGMIYVVQDRPDTGESTVFAVFELYQLMGIVWGWSEFSEPGGGWGPALGMLFGLVTGSVVLALWAFCVTALFVLILHIR